MFHREFKYGTTCLVIHVAAEPAHSSRQAHFFGFPLYDNIGAVDNDSIADVISEVKGYFLYVGVDGNRTLVANDIAGGYRVYTCRVGATTYISDDYAFILDRLREQAALEFSEHEYEFWKKHRYTTGGTTFIRRCDKLPPAGLLTADQSGTRVNTYFADVGAESDASLHSELFFDDLADTLRHLGRAGRPIILFVSGGNDSTLLAMMLRELRIDFTPVAVRLRNPSFPANEQDCLSAQQVARFLGLTLFEIEVNLADLVGEAESIVREMMFDRHFSLLHFGALRKLEREGNRDAIVVNGQSCDTVLSHGPSGNTSGDFAARVLCHRPMTLWSALAGMAVTARHGRRYSTPGRRRDYLISRLDPFQYYCVRDKGADDAYGEYLGRIVDRLTAEFTHANSLNMYLSLYGFLQGADNQVVIRSARSAGINRVIMPYASPQVIHATTVYRDASMEIRHPKYPVTDALGRLGFCRPATIQRQRAIGFTPEQERLVAIINDEFIRQATRLAAAKSGTVTR